MICPKAKGFTRSFEELEDVHIHRYPLPVDAQGTLGFVAEFLWCFVRTASRPCGWPWRVGASTCSTSAIRRRPTGPSAALAAVRQALPVRPPRPVAGDVPGEVRLGGRAGWPGCDSSSARRSDRRPRHDHQREPPAGGGRARGQASSRRVHRALRPGPGAPGRPPARPGMAEGQAPPARLPRRDLQAGRSRPPGPGGETAARRTRPR